MYYLYLKGVQADINPKIDVNQRYLLLDIWFGILPSEKVKNS